MTATLLVTIDTEEEFDWSAPFSSDNRSVEHARELPRLQDLFEELGVVPTYVVDYPIATSPLSIRVLGEFARREACEIGAHLHPWVNPPLEEEINAYNSYLCNLPLTLQQEKAARLTEAIEQSFGIRPTTFKAGRYGIDWRLIPYLSELGYTVDTSVISTMDLTADGGPSFTGFGNAPFRIEPPLVPGGDADRRLLEVPCTVGFSRRPFAFWDAVHRVLSHDRYHCLHPIGILWHLRIMRKIVLTPEGTDVADQIRLLRVLGRERDAMLNVTLHSPSIQPGNTPFVRTAGDRDRFLDRLRTTLRFAIEQLGAQPTSFRQFAENFQHTKQPA